MQVAQLQSTANSPTTSYGPYALRPNDQVRVQVYNEPDITGDYQVDSAGYLSIPLAGRVKAAGLTASQLERSITSRLKGGILNDPRVTIQVSTYAPIYIHGEVKKSGEFPFRPGLTVMDAVAAAGGFTYRADDSRAYVRRSGTCGVRLSSRRARSRFSRRQHQNTRTIFLIIKCAAVASIDGSSAQRHHARLWNICPRYVGHQLIFSHGDFSAVSQARLHAL